MDDERDLLFGGGLTPSLAEVAAVLCGVIILLEVAWEVPGEEVGGKLVPSRVVLPFDIFLENYVCETSLVIKLWKNELKNKRTFRKYCRVRLDYSGLRLYRKPALNTFTKKTFRMVIIPHSYPKTNTPKMLLWKGLYLFRNWWKE